MTGLPKPDVSVRAWWWCLALLVAAYAHHTLPYLTMMPRVNVDEPWLIERAYEVLHTGRPLQPMLGLTHAYLLQPGYGYLVAPWIGLFGVGIFQTRLLAVILGLGVVLAVAGTGRRLSSRAAGLLAAAFLLSDSNFLGGARMARTDIPAVFFVATSLWCFVVGRDTTRVRWYVVSGLCTAAAILCHGNSFWIAVILCVWYLIEHGRASFLRPQGYAYAAAALVGLSPYLAVVAMDRHEVAVQIASFAGDRVPGWQPSFILQQIGLEAARYRDWYFGLVTDTVPNPLLRVFQIAIVGGLLRLAYVMMSRRSSPDDRRHAILLLTLSLGAAFIFAAFINNKALVYIPHLLLGFSLVAGVFVAWVATVMAAACARVLPSRRVSVAGIAIVLVVSHAVAGVAYYEKWYALTRRTELLPYEATARTVTRLVPAGPKTIMASPHFWVPFAGQPGVDFFSHAAPGPEGADGDAWPPWVSPAKPFFLLIDERQFEPELVAASGDPHWQKPWVTFITRQCRLRGYAPATAYGTIASYECARHAPPSEQAVVLASDAATYTVGGDVLADGVDALARWHPHVDPRADAGPTRIDAVPGGVRVAGPRWPGLERTVSLDAGSPYLLTADVRATSALDLIYIGQWKPSEVTSLSVGSSGGIVEPAERPAWFPGGHAFIASSARVRLLFYSERPDAEFVVSSVRLSRLTARIAPVK